MIQRRLRPGHGLHVIPLLLGLGGVLLELLEALLRLLELLVPVLDDRRLQQQQQQQQTVSEDLQQADRVQKNVSGFRTCLPGTETGPSL